MDRVKDRNRERDFGDRDRDRGREKDCDRSRGRDREGARDYQVKGRSGSRERDREVDRDYQEKGRNGSRGRDREGDREYDRKGRSGSRGRNREIVRDYQDKRGSGSRGRDREGDREHEDKGYNGSRGRDRENVREYEDKGRSVSRDNDRGRAREREQDRSPSPRPTSKSGKKKKSKKSKDKKKHKKEKKRSGSRKRDSSAASDSSDLSVASNDSMALMVKLEEERKKQLEDMKKRKEVLKQMETPEEKRKRRLAKKEEKERKRKERMGWDNEYLHYTNSDNPFGDSNILETFVWKKKLEKVGLKDISHEEVERINRMKQEENKRELEKVKKRRLEREQERMAREEEQQLLQREKEANQFKEWGAQEDMFHLEQARLRSKIRIKDGRAKPIDLLAQYISAEEEVDAIEMHEPYTYLNGLTVSDLEDLIEDIKVYKEIEHDRNISYWNDITVIVEDELRKLRKLEQDDDYRVALERREGINAAVTHDVATIFKGKTAEQLQALKQQIQSKLDGSSSGVDISYWESLLSQLKAHIARAQLRDRHQENLRQKLALLKAEQGVADPEGQESPAPGPSSSAAAMRNPDEIPMDEDEESQHSMASAEAAAASETDEDDDTKEYVDETVLKYEHGGYSPKMISQDQIEPGIFVIGEEEDNARLHLARSQVLNVGQKVENVWTAEEKALQHEAKKGMAADEATFAVETPVDQVYLWSDKYRPRKPRYFNRVHTGFEWNKYNQTHYDMDNPPPKIVQGYKFNIFYPDLMDKNNTPQYFLVSCNACLVDNCTTTTFLNISIFDEFLRLTYLFVLFQTTCADNQDFAILRFHAGPPYEDIAFKIVNREWEYSYKRGFRCQFQNNIFQLWFHFKRYRYRR